MKFLLKTCIIAYCLVSQFLCSNLTINLTDTMTEYISTQEAQKLFINYSANFWENSSLFLSIDPIKVNEQVKMIVCDRFAPLQCIDASIPFFLPSLKQSNLFFLIEIEPYSTYLIRSFLSIQGTKLNPLPSFLLKKDDTKDHEIILDSESIFSQGLAVISFRIHNFSRENKYQTSFKYSDNLETNQECIDEFISTKQCILKKIGKYFFSIKNFGNNSIFFIEYFITQVNYFLPNSELLIRGFKNLYSFIHLSNDNAVPMLITTDFKENSQLSLISKTIKQGDDSTLPTLGNGNNISLSGTIIFQPNTSNYLATISSNDFNVILISQLINIVHVPIGREIVTNFEHSRSLYAFFHTSINYVPSPFYLTLTKIPDQSDYSVATWFITRGSDPAKLQIPTEDYHIFSSKDTFYLLIEYPQTIYFTLKYSRTGNYSFFLKEKSVSSVVNNPHTKPFPYFWIVFGLTLLEVAFQFLILLILFLRDRCGSSIIINREQVQPEPENRNFGPKSADEVKIDGLDELTLSKNPSKTISKEEILCIICMDKKRNVIFSPCNHKISCIECSKKLYFETKKCPICRRDIETLRYEKTPNL